jgi:hypothetical protein
VEFETNLPLFFDSYRACRWTGSLILIDALSNATVGAAMIVGPAVEAALGTSPRLSLIVLPGHDDFAHHVRDALVARGERAVVIDDPLIPDSAVAAVVRALDLAGVTAVSARVLSKAAIAEIEASASGSVQLEDGVDEEEILKALAVKL